MEELLFMTVDLGTSFIKVGIYNTSGGCLVKEEETVKQENPSSGVFIQKGAELFDSVLRCIKRASVRVNTKTNNIEAIAFTGQMAGFMGVDKEWNDITTWSCSLDTRYVPYAKHQMERFGSLFLETAGTNSPLMAPKFEWFCKEFPEESKKIEKYMVLSSYIIGRLGDLPIEEAVIERSYITWSGFADIHHMKWSDKLCSILGMPLQKLPRIVKADEVCGALSSRWAYATGLKAGIPLIAGAGDKVAGCLGAGVSEKGDMIFEAASYGGFSCMVEEYRANREEPYYDAVSAGRKGILAHHYIPGSGITLNWFIQNFAGQYGKNAFQVMDRKAGNVPPGCQGLMAVGLLGGSAMPLDGKIKGMWIGFDWSHKKEHFYRALLESFSYDLSLTIDSIEKKYPEYHLDNVKLIGGGANSAVWPQILADVTGKNFEKLNRSDIAMWGAAILAGVGIGVFKETDAVAKEHVGITQVFQPDQQNYSDYRKQRTIYESLLK